MLDNCGHKNAKVVAMNARSDPNVYVKYWIEPLCGTCTARPGYCCFAMWCSYCASWSLRKQALHGDMSRYICCNGACPCSGRCGEKSCPSCCLCLEVCCCFAMSVATTRFMIQDELRIQTTKCDNCIIGTMIALEYIACIFHIVACITGSEEIRQIANCIQLFADLVWCSVCACMQTQHKIEMDQRDKSPGAIPPPLPGMVPPGVQMIPMGAPPPHVYPPHGYPPQQQGYPPQGYPPQQQGYPPQGYPPQQGYPQQQMRR